MPIAEVQFYDVVLFFHLTAVLAAFGATFAYPALFAVASTTDPRVLPYLHRVLDRWGTMVIFPGTLIILASGIYMASDRWDFEGAWIHIGQLAIVAFIVLGLVFHSPTGRKLTQISERDVKEAGGGEVVLSDEYRRLARREAVVGSIETAIVVAVLFLMATKPF